MPDASGRCMQFIGGRHLVVAVVGFPISGRCAGDLMLACLFS